MKGPLPSARCAHTASLVNKDKLLVFGGGDGIRRFKDVYLLDLQHLLDGGKKLRESKRRSSRAGRGRNSSKNKNKPSAPASGGNTVAPVSDVHEADRIDSQATPVSDGNYSTASDIEDDEASNAPGTTMPIPSIPVNTSPLITGSVDGGCCNTGGSTGVALLPISAPNASQVQIKESVNSNSGTVNHTNTSNNPSNLDTAPVTATNIVNNTNPSNANASGISTNSGNTGNSSSPRPPNPSASVPSAAAIGPAVIPIVPPIAQGLTVSMPRTSANTSANTSATNSSMSTPGTTPRSLSPHATTPRSPHLTSALPPMSPQEIYSHLAKHFAPGVGPGGGVMMPPVHLQMQGLPVQPVAGPTHGPAAVSPPVQIAPPIHQQHLKQHIAQQSIPNPLQQAPLTVPPIAAWLTGIGLGIYIDNFVREEIDMDVLPLLTEQHLQETLGIPTLGARLRILNNAKQLVTGTAAGTGDLSLSPPPPPPPPPPPQTSQRPPAKSRRNNRNNNNNNNNGNNNNNTTENQNGSGISTLRTSGKWPSASDTAAPPPTKQVTPHAPLPSAPATLPSETPSSKEVLSLKHELACRTAEVQRMGHLVQHLISTITSNPNQQAQQAQAQQAQGASSSSSSAPSVDAAMSVIPMAAQAYAQYNAPHPHNLLYGTNHGGSPGAPLHTQYNQAHVPQGAPASILHQYATASPPVHQSIQGHMPHSHNVIAPTHAQIHNQVGVHGVSHPVYSSSIYSAMAPSMPGAHMALPGAPLSPPPPPPQFQKVVRMSPPSNENDGRSVPTDT